MRDVLGKIERGVATLRKLEPARLDPIAWVATVRERRSARRTASGLDFALADRIDMLHPEHWDALAAQTVFLSRPYCACWSAMARPTSHRAMRWRTPTGRRWRSCCSGASRSAATACASPARARSSTSRSRLREHLLVCGNLLVWGARAIAFAPGADATLLWQGVAEAAYRLRRADKLLGESDVALIKDFGVGQQVARDTLRRIGYRSVDTEPDMVLALKPEWRRQEDYLASLTSSYRSGAKMLIKDCAAAGVVLRTIDAAEMLARRDELHALDRQVHQAQGLRLATLSPDDLPAMAQALGPRFVSRIAEREGRALAFVTSVGDGATAIGYYIGYDRETNALAPVYLALLQSTVGDAIGFGASRLSLGRTALEPKAKMGCLPEPLACAVRHPVSALNPLVSALTLTATHDERPLRSPFKKQAAAEG